MQKTENIVIILLILSLVIFKREICYNDDFSFCLFFPFEISLGWQINKNRFYPSEIHINRYYQQNDLN